MHPYRTHNCGELRAANVGQIIRLSGWIHSKRDHGGLQFMDLRDHYGITQIVISTQTNTAKQIEHIRVESVVTITGLVVLRAGTTVNSKIPTGDIEIRAESIVLQSEADILPFQVAGYEHYPDDLRLKYRYLDLRRERQHGNIVLRSQVIASLRKRMLDLGFMEFQTPILTATSPEGARDFVVPSRLHPGNFYALPQAPQQFKQLAMVAGFDRYFQIAPCFRDEDSRSDRSPGEFYQLDIEMSYVTQDDVFATLEPVIEGVFCEFSNGRRVTSAPFERIPYIDALRYYGSDKPDLRNPLIINDVSICFANSSFARFADIIAQGGSALAIPAPQAGMRPRSFFDKLNDVAKTHGAAGLGYMIFEETGPKGPIARNLEEERAEEIKELCGLKSGDAVFFLAGEGHDFVRISGVMRNEIANALDVMEKDSFRFCWITDFPMYETNKETGLIDFSHNPFSMPQGGIEALNTLDPFAIKAYQYDIVCNGVELSSGAIRNHKLDIMTRAFEIAGYSKKDIEDRFGGLLNAFHYGVPPHGGAAPGIDRMVMLLAEEPNIREIVLFPPNQQGEDLMMRAPTELSPQRLKELSLKIVKSSAK